MIYRKFLFLFLLLSCAFSLHAQEEEAVRKGQLFFMLLNFGRLIFLKIFW